MGDLEHLLDMVHYHLDCLVEFDHTIECDPLSELLRMLLVGTVIKLVFLVGLVSVSSTRGFLLTALVWENLLQVG